MDQRPPIFRPLDEFVVAAVRRRGSLPPRAKAYLAARDGDIRIDDADLRQAENATWTATVRLKVQRLVAAGAFAEANDLLQERRGPSGVSLLPDLEVEHQPVIELLCAAEADPAWDELLERSRGDLGNAISNVIDEFGHDSDVLGDLSEAIASEYQAEADEASVGENFFAAGEAAEPT